MPDGSANGHSAADINANASRTKKRNRAVLSCATCHSRRVKCNREHPCETCISTGKAHECTYISRAPRAKAARTTSSSEEDVHGAVDGRASSSRADQSSPDQNFASIPKTVNYNQTAKPDTPSSSSTGLQYPMSAFFTFVERFQQHTQANDRDNVVESAYPADVIAIINAARNDLPTPDRTRLLIIFFFDHLEWSYDAGDFDELNQWLDPFLHRMSLPSVSFDRFEKGDVTKLCLIITILATTIQGANEGLIQTFFLDSNISFTPMRMTRLALKETYDAHLRNLLDSAAHQDGSSIGLIRCSLMYCYILKNDGRHYESGNEPFLKSISHLVKQEELHLDPLPALYTPEQADSRRRLFWTFYCFNRMTAAHTGFPLSIADSEITTKEPNAESWSPVLGRRINLYVIYRSRLCGIGSKMALFLSTDGVPVHTVKLIDEQLVAWYAALPPEMDASLPVLSPDLHQLRTFDIQRRVLHVIYHSVRSALHRLCFFPTESISMDQVRISRRICVTSAMNMIKEQEGLRLRLVGEHHLRFFFLPYFMLEAAITLVLTTLIEVGNVPLGNTIPDNINEYMKWGHRALHLLLSLPSDFPPAAQGARLLSRVLTKATQILDLHAQRKLTQMDSNSAIRDVLLDDQGRKMSIPLHEGPNGSSSSRPSSSAHHNSASDSGNARTPASLTSSSSYGDFSSGFPQSTSDYVPAVRSRALPDYTTIASIRSKQNTLPNRPTHSFQADTQMPQGLPSGEPTYADMGLDFFDTMASSLTNPFLSEADSLLMSQQMMPQQDSQPYVQPATPSNGMDDQMNAWLASLQSV